MQHLVEQEMGLEEPENIRRVMDFINLTIGHARRMDSIQAKLARLEWIPLDAEPVVQIGVLRFALAELESEVATLQEEQAQMDEWLPIMASVKAGWRARHEMNADSTASEIVLDGRLESVNSSVSGAFSAEEPLVDNPLSERSMDVLSEDSWQIDNYGGIEVPGGRSSEDRMPSILDTQAYMNMMIQSLRLPFRVLSTSPSDSSGQEVHVVGKRRDRHLRTSVTDESLSTEYLFKKTVMGFGFPFESSCNEETE